MLRTALALIMLVLLLPAVVIANATNWAARTVVDDDAFASTVGRVLDTPTLRAVIAQRVSDEVTAYLAANPATFSLLATEVLHVPASVTIDDVRTALRARLGAALDDPAVRQARDEAVATVHAYLIGAATAQDQAVRIQGEDLVLDMGPLIERLALAVDPRLTPALVRLPEADRLVVLANASALRTARDTITVIELVQFLIPLVAIVAALAILTLAHRRVRALGLVGVAVMVAGVVTLAAAWLGGEAIGGATSDITVRQITTEVYTAFVTILAWQAAALVAVGLIVVLVAWQLSRRRRNRRAPTGASMPAGSSPA